VPSGNGTVLRGGGLFVGLLGPCSEVPPSICIGVVTLGTSPGVVTLMNPVDGIAPLAMFVHYVHAAQKGLFFFCDKTIPGGHIAADEMP
jgi:hypothetical protein